MVSARVVIPWRPSPSRRDAFDRVQHWYGTYLPEFTVETLDTDDHLFSLARVRNLGVASLSRPDEVIVINDADTIPEPIALRAAVTAAQADHRVHLPYTEYRWLGRDGSAQFAAGCALSDCDFELVIGACSGVYVTTRQSWELHGGQDDRFRGWGFEDAAWMLAHETLLGASPVRHEGRVYALHHVGESRAGAQYDRNAALMERYRDAANNPAAMSALVAEGQLIQPASAA